MKVLDYIGLTRLIERIKLYFLDKDTYNSYAEYQVVPSTGIQLSAEASVLYVLFSEYDGGGISIQREVFLTSMKSDYSVLLLPGHVQSFNPKYQ